MKGKYQLVLQFRGDSLDDYDAMIALEDDLIAELHGLANQNTPQKHQDA